MDEMRRRDVMGVALGGLAYVAGQGSAAGAAAPAPGPASAASPVAVRRVVTGTNAAGRSVFLMDGPSPHVYQRTAESVAVIELWETRAAPASNAGDADAIDHPLRLQPPARGSSFRMLRFMPERQQKAAIAEQMAAGDDGSGIVSAMRKGSGGRAAGFHKTDTVDYAIVISGEIYALMDEGERLLKAGDVLIQRGTNHAWSNRSDAPALVAFVLVDAEPLGTGEAR